MGFMNGQPSKNPQTGQAALISVIVISSVALVIAFSISLIAFTSQRIVRNVIQSSQSYYAAEAGVEDALLRVSRGMNWSSPSILQVGSATVNTTTSAPIGGVRTITGEGNAQNRFRTVELAYTPATQGVSFFYGAQVGEGGLTMDNNSEIIGNVYSNSTASGSGTITETITVAGNSNKIDGLTVGADANVHSCEDSDITGTLTHVTGGTIERCDAGTIVDGGPDEIEALDFPISQEMIDGWKSDAATGGTLTGDQTISTDTTLGPVKIDGNLSLENNVIVTVTGTIWITGNFDPENNSQMILDEDAYDTTSGVVIADDTAFVHNNVVLSGTSASTSYLLFIGNSPSTDLDNPAIDVKNNVAGAILFTPSGTMRIRNNVDVVEATAYQMHLDNNATIAYEIGLANATFTSGPSGGSGVISWREVE